MLNKQKTTPLSNASVWVLGTLVLGTSALSGCGSADRVQLASAEMDVIKAAPAGQVEDIPRPEPVKDYFYDSEGMRSPFLPSSLLNRQEQIESIEGVRPDVTRIKEPLEKFELSQLTYRGLVVSPEGEQYGLIQRPDGLIDSVKVGDYMGLNDGRIVELTSTQINLIEIVQDSRAGYIEKPAAIISP